jgi:hypothetical protein
MDIKKSKGHIDLSEARMLFYGPPKFGKTTLLSGWPNLLLLATEKGYGALKMDVQDITSWEQFKDVVKDLTTKSEYKKKYRTIGIDTIDLLANMCIEEVCGELEIDHISDAKWGKAYDRLKKSFESEINKLFMSDYGILMTSHTKIQELSNFGGTISKTIPTINAQCRAILIPKIDVIGCMRIETYKNQEGKYKDRRVISFRPHETYESGDRTGALPDKLVVYKDAKKTYAEFNKCFTKGGSM